MALDFHEERKWKKGMNYVLSNQIAGKVKKNKSMKKLDELYKKCMCLYLSMNVNNNITDISLGKDNKNMNTRLNTYIKSISDLDYLRDQFDNWKNSLQMLKIKIDKKFGQKNINKAQNFLKVLNLMENMISIQEDTIKRLNEIKERAIQQSIKINQTPNFTNFLEDIDEEMRANERFRMNIDNNFYMEQTNILDLNTVGKEMNQLIEEITNEVLNYYEGTDNGMMLSSTNSATPGDLSTTSTNIMTQDQMYVEDLHCQADHDVMSGVNPKQLFYDSKNISNNPKDLRMYLEKITNSDKVDILPNYNYKKVSGAEIDVNLDEFGKVWLKVFPCIFSLDRSKDMMIDSEIEFYKMKNYRALKDQEHLRLYQHKFENMTSMQKLILFWALCQYGTYMNIICEIPNIFSISKSVNYDPEEINIFLDKALEQLGIDMYASNFENLQFGEKNNRNKAMFIYNIDPAMLNSTQCNFIYNRKILNYVHHRTDKVNRILDETENKHGISTYKPYNELNSISLVYYCPLFKPASIKKLMFKYLYEELKRFCDKFENLYNVQNTMQTYNYYTMQKNSTVKESKKV